jgi:ribosomal protein S18 acetylase RimI-like enzyme
VHGSVRAATALDAEGIARVHTRSWQVGYRGIVPDSHLDALSWETRRSWWAEALAEPWGERRCTYVAVDEHQEVAGFCALGRARDDDLADGTHEVYALYVDPSAWGRGFGTRLMERTLLDLPREAPGIALWVLSANDRGRRFYASYGFAPDGSTKVEDFDGETLEEVRLLRTIG